MAPRQRRNLDRDPWIVIVGLGRLGSALAFHLRRRSWRVAVWADKPSVRRRAREIELPLAKPKIIRDAALFFLSVPDREVATAAESVASVAPRGALVHCAGALSLSVFSGLNPKRAVGSFHPLSAISSAGDALGGHSVAISANAVGLRRLLRRIARDLGLRPLSVPDKRRSIYHAGAVLSAQGLVALADAAIEAFQAAQVPRPEATRAILALMGSALRGAGRQGLERSLTGPIARGDAETVRMHLAALPPSLRPLYSELGRRALKLASKQIPAGVRRDLLQILGY